MSIFSPQFPSQPSPAGATVATTTFPTELAPFIKDILEKAKAQQTDASYQPYTGPQLAQFSDREKAAMDAIIAQTTGLAGTDVAKATPYFTGAKTAVEGLGQQFTGDVAQQYMNPYQQAVVDQAKQKAIENYEQVIAPKVTAQAIAQQPFGGSRQAIAEGMARQDLTDKLTEIQERGLADAYNQGRAAFEAQKARELKQSQQLAQLGQTIPQQALRDLAIQQQTGEQERRQEQLGLDLAKGQFLEEREFPTRALQEYSAVVRGFPFQPSTYTAQTQYKAQPSIGQQLLQLGATGLGAYTQFGGELPQIFGAQGGGIANIYANQQGLNRQRPRQQPTQKERPIQGPPIDPVEFDGPSAPVDLDRIRPLLGLPDAAFEEQTGMTKQQFEMLDAMPEYGKSSLDKAKPFMIPEQPGDRQKGFGFGVTPQGTRSRFQYMNEGGLTGLPVVYNQVGTDIVTSNLPELLQEEKEGQKIFEQAEKDKNLLAPFIRQGSGQITQGGDVIDTQGKEYVGQGSMFDIDLTSGYTAPDTTIKVGKSGNLVDDLTNLYTSQNIPMPEALKTKIDELNDIANLESKALTAFEDEKSAIQKAKTRADELFQERSSPEALKRRKDEALKRKQKGIGAAIAQAAAEPIDPDESFVQTVSRIVGGTSKLAQPVQKEFDDFMLKEEDRELNAQLGLIDSNTKFFEAQSSLEQANAALQGVNIDKKNKVIGAMLQSEQISSTTKNLITKSALEAAIANTTNNLKKQELKNNLRINEVNLKLTQAVNNDNFYLGVMKNKLDYATLTNEISKNIAETNLDMSKEFNDLSKDLPSMISGHFDIDIGPNGMPTEGQSLTPQFLLAYSKSIAQANNIMRENAIKMQNPDLLGEGEKGIQLTTGIYSNADKIMKDAYTFVGPDMHDKLSQEGVGKATEKTTAAFGYDPKGSKGVNTTLALNPSYTPDDNLIATYQEIGAEMFKPEFRIAMTDKMRALFEKKKIAFPDDIK